MSVQHTPGPWKAYPIEMNHGLPYTPVAANTLLAKVYSEAFGDYEQSEANARLVAAAPDLLEALRRVVNDWVAPDGLPFEDGEMPALDAARAAISKATGGKA